MFDKLEILQMAHGMATHAASRQSVIARNVANADTPGFRARDIESFAEIYRADDGGMALRATRAGHLPDAGGDGTAHHFRTFRTGEAAPNGNSVALEAELMKSAETKMQHDMAMAVYGSALTVLRASIGR